MHRNDQGNDVNRREFIKGAAVMTAAVLAGNILEPTEGAAAANSDNLLKGVSDLHVHCEPDVKSRQGNAIDLALKCQRNGYRALMLKGHDLPTHDHAYLVRQVIPDFNVFGGVALNKPYGDTLNLTAVKKAINAPGNFCKCIWMPTQGSVWDSQHHGNKEKGVKGIPITDSTGKLLPEVTTIMEMCGKANIIFATGHSSPVECVAMAKRAKEIGIPKFVVTHATSDIWTLTKEQVQVCLENGAYIEHTYNATLMGPGTALSKYGYTPLETIAEYIRLAPERTFICTDFGNKAFGDYVEGMHSFITRLNGLGFSTQEIDVIARTNPAKLMSLEA